MQVEIPTESHGEEPAKAPLSPVINNIQKNKNSTFKWGKLTDKFGYDKDKVKIENSPSTNYKFKAVTRIPSARETEESKENAVILSQNSDTKELPLSQSSVVSEVSIVSDVGSIDNESFGLTPTPEMSVKSDNGSEVASPPSITRAMVCIFANTVLISFLYEYIQLFYTYCIKYCTVFMISKLKP